MNLKTRPLTDEARRRMSSKPPIGSQFSASWSDTKALLLYELDRLGAVGDAVLMLDITEDDIRLDNSLRANASPASGAVALSVQTKDGPLLITCDRFRRSWGQVAWQQNARAIALGLEALRKVRRYGIAEANEQYTGFKALPGEVPEQEYLTAEESARFLLDASGLADQGVTYDLLLTSGAIRKTAYREAAKRLHPDAGGSGEDFLKLKRVKEVLG